MKRLGESGTARDIFVLTTGRRFYAHGGYIGINVEADDISEGYDGTPAPENPADDAEECTRAERHEIAAEMVRRWKVWANGPIEGDA